MVLRISKTILRIIFLGAIASIFSCEQVLLVDCSTCSTSDLTKAKIEIHVDGLPSFDYIHHVVIYLGKLEDNVRIDSLDTRYDTSVNLKLNTEYTFTSTTMIDGKTFIAVDNIIPRTRAYYGCEEPCYVLVDTNVNLKLKHTH